ncbi:MAG: YHS domain-containing (seleno)protein [Pseudomonadota bacterium]
MTVSRRAVLGLGLALPAAALLSRPAWAGTPPVYSSGGIAIDGSDPVAYFTEGAPMEGDAAITHDWQGVTWRFANETNRDAFAADPVAYAPQYGGYCAWAVAQGYTAPTAPDAWAVVDGKLYLNYSRRIQRRWERDIPGFIAAADANWPGVLA